MSNDENHYRKQAADAQGFADRAISDADKASWLRIAQGWMGLIRKPKQTASEAFDADAKAQGTGQDSSDRSN